MESITHRGFPHRGGNQYNQQDYTGSGSKWATSSSTHFACFTVCNVHVSEPKPTTPTATTSTTGKDCPEINENTRTCTMCVCVCVCVCVCACVCSGKWVLHCLVCSFKIRLMQLPFGGLP